MPCMKIQTTTGDRMMKQRDASRQASPRQDDARFPPGISHSAPLATAPSYPHTALYWDTTMYQQVGLGDPFDEEDYDDDAFDEAGGFAAGRR